MPFVKCVEYTGISLDELLEEADLTGIEAIEVEKPKVAKARAFVIQQADEMLAKALTSSVRFCFFLSHNTRKCT